MAFNKLNILDPCRQNWDNMIPVGNGRHCTSCNKVIVDFSELSDQELIRVLQNTKPHCGRFSEEQMGTMFYIQEKSRERKKYWNSVAAAIVAGVLQISSGYNQTTRQTQQLYPRRLAIEKYSLEKEQTNPEIQKEEKKLVNIIVYRSGSETGLRDIQISIKEIGIEGTTQTGGTFMFEITEDMDLNQWVNIDVDTKHLKLRFAPGFSTKNLRVKLNDLVNQTKIILMEPKKSRHRGGLKLMGLIPYDPEYYD